MRCEFIAALAFSALPLVSAQLSWSEAYSKAEDTLSGLSLSEKVGIVTGVGWKKGPCVGNTYPVTSIGYPSLCLQDGPLGIRFATSATAFTPIIQAASTWDLELIRQRSQYHAEEAKALGIHVLLAPVVGPLGKQATGGRNWEGWGSDPYLAGIGAGVAIEAMQAVGVQATIKHYIGNEQEHNRETMSSNIDDRTMHELYLWPYYDSVHANVAAAMCSYNKLNGTWACEDEHTMKTLLKEELGFPGYIMSDWNAQHSTVKSAVTGLDMTMPGDDFSGGHIYWGPQLQTAVKNETVPAERVDDMVTRILAAWYKMGQDTGYPSTDLSRNVQGSHAANVRAVARDGIVLLKNKNSILPLHRPSSIAVIGSGAVIGDHANNLCKDKGCNNGALGMGWGSGSVQYPYFVAPYDAINERASSYGAKVTLSGSDNTTAAATAAKGKDVALVFITADAGEEYITVEGNKGDRNDLLPWHQGIELVRAVASANKNVVVVVHSVGPIILSDILALPSVKGIVWAGLPSQESGNALVDIVWGDTNPSGKLVYTIAKSADDYNTKIVSGDDDFPEGLFIDYRHFDQAGIKPEFEFGFGLSYTKFEYKHLTVDSIVRSGPTKGQIVPGGAKDLFDTVATVTASIKNHGRVAGAEVAQLYITYPSSAPGTPPKQLRGFAKLHLEPGRSGQATFNIRRRDLSVWDTTTQKWTVPRGRFGVSVGASSRDIKLKGTINVY